MSRKPFSDIKPWFAAAAVLGGVSALVGCALALPAYNQPFEERVIVISPSPQGVRVWIDGSRQESIQVPADGRTVLRFPVLPRECSTYLFGLRIKDRSVEARKLVEFVRDGRVIKKVSVNDLRALSVDSAGYHELELR